MTLDSSQIFVARQPILDRHRRLVAYELLFRDSAETGFANVLDASHATARVAIDTFLSMGISTVLGPYRGFLNVDLEMLASEAIEALPAERFVLEVLETVPPWALERCLQLKERGFEIALDDYVPGDGRYDLLQSADYVKVDLTLTDSRSLAKLVRELKAHPTRLLAEKVETNLDFAQCVALDFELFQGYFFAKPTTLTGNKLELERAGLLSVFRVLSGDGSTHELEDIFKRDARLGVQLLRIANSAALGSIQKITTFEHAIMYVGRAQLRRWILLMLYASGGDSQSLNPAIELAAVRGRLLELLAPMIPASSNHDLASKEGAFLAGMLSLGDAILGASLRTIVDELRVEPLVGSAILDHSGSLGELLRVAEALETGHFGDITELLDSLGLSAEQLTSAQQEAFSWFRGMGADDVIGGAN